MLIVSVREGEQGESEGRRVVRYPDAQQLFVGNVPHDVDKTELKEFFERKSTQQRKNDHVFKIIFIYHKPLQSVKHTITNVSIVYSKI